MQQEEDLVACQNCQQKFPSAKIDLHEAYCRRNIKKCKICTKMVDINEEEAHFNQFHAQKPCDFCQREVQATQLQKHKENCEERPVQCKFCQNPFPFSTIPRHEEECGSRTKRCDICRNYIKIRQFESHAATCRLMEPPRNESTENRRNLQNGLGGHRNRLNSNDKIKRERTKEYPENPWFKQRVYRGDVIGREPISQLVDPIPISVRLAMLKTNKQARKNEKLND